MAVNNERSAVIVTLLKPLFVKLFVNMLMVPHSIPDRRTIITLKDFVLVNFFITCYISLGASILSILSTFAITVFAATQRLSLACSNSSASPLTLQEL